MPPDTPDPTAVKPRADHVFLNVPFDDGYAPLYVTIIACLTALGMTPRSVLEVPHTDGARLLRLQALIRECGASIHDLSRVERSGGVPRFNMPFELGLTMGLHQGGGHSWVVLEAVRYRVGRSLSDLGGYDGIWIHGGTVDGVIHSTNDAFRSTRRKVDLKHFKAMSGTMGVVAKRMKRDRKTLFSRRSFEDLVLAGHETARLYFESVPRR